MVLPIEEYTYVSTRLRYLRAASQSLPAFKPDGRGALYIADQPALATQAFTDLLTKFNAVNLSDGAMRTAHAAGHDAAVAVYACMKSCYRKDPGCAKGIRTLPKGDKTPEKTFARMKALATLWDSLPNLPVINTPLEVGEITAGVLGSMASDLDGKLNTAKVTSSQYSSAVAVFQGKLAAWDNFVSAAAIQGRVLYKPGTAERAHIDRIPTAPATQPPAQTEFTKAENPAAGIVQLEFNAAHATSFKVFHKGPGEAAFAEVADILLPGQYTATGLAAGAHEYKVAGVNSRGTGPESSVASVNVAQAAAA